MDPHLYQIIAQGDVDSLKQTPISHLYQNTVVKNTTLHVAVQFERDVCVEEILIKFPTVLFNVNENNDTALHFAAREGLSAITQLLIDSARKVYGPVSEYPVKRLLSMTNKNIDTALHEAVRNRHLMVVKLLTETYREFEYFANDAGETPLFLAVEIGNYEMVAQILQTCPSSAHDGPNGMTALHAAAMSQNSDIARLLLEKKPNLVRKADERGWTSLHYAAYVDFGEMAIQLLKLNRSLAYILDKNGMSPLHIASSKGSHHVMKELIQLCPDCLELQDYAGRNFLHIAVVRSAMRSIESALVATTMTKGIINQPDNDGNTPLHLAALAKDYDIVKLLCEDNRVKKWVMNKENLTALTIFETKAGLEDDISPGSKYWEVIKALRSNGNFQGWRGNIFKDLRKPPTSPRHRVDES